MSFFLRWLGLDIARPGAVGTRAVIRFALSVPVEVAYDRAKRGLLDVLGATITNDDSARLDASFGLLFSQRIVVRISPTAEGCEVSLESMRAVSSEPAAKTAEIERLAEFMRSA